tara:strand:- start:342 stop:1160 length:819 start_codon:yes stop_codon:yes gene_type:complete
VANKELQLSEDILNSLLPLEQSISKEGLQKIYNRLPELDRAKKAVGRKNSQTTATLMTMTMLADSPYRQMKQCLSQIDNKRNALTKAFFKIEKQLVNIRKWEKSDTEMDQIKAREARVMLEQGKVHSENAMKEIGMYQDIYDQIRISHNIPENWDEADFESQEIDHALRMSFRKAIQNIQATGRIAISTSEYWEQFGVHPLVGEKLTREYMASVDNELKENKLPSVQSMHNFIEKMVETFRNEYKHSLTRIGVDAVINHQYAYKKKPAESKK